MLRVSRLLNVTFRHTRFYSSEAIQKEPLSPLSKHLHDSIKITGPLTVAHYMRQVLVNPLSGYYMTGDVFGRQGDFITSPEISQVFGELCGLWYLTEWMRLGQPSKTQIIEFGPGRGTLMSDILRTVAQFPKFYQTLTDVHFIEASPSLRKIQRLNLIGESEDDINKKEDANYSVRKDGIRVSWHDGVELVPDQWSFVMAHEFFDALPIHIFEKYESEWREMLIDLDDTDESEHNFRIVRSNKPTAMTKTYLNDEKFKNFNDGDKIEVSPDSWNVMKNIAKFIEKNGGTGLAIDYGQDYIQGDTLRAIKQHKIIHPMSDPGTADLSADVDFSFLKDAIKKESNIDAYGPITQMKFLQSMGIQARVEQLFKNAKSSEARKTLLDGAERLMDPNRMGRIYKVLSFCKESDSVRGRPIGFE